MEDFPDEVLLRLILEGNQLAFRELYRREAGYVHAVIRRLINCPDEVEQTLFEAFSFFYRDAVHLRDLTGKLSKDELYRLAKQRAWTRRNLEKPIELSFEYQEPFLFAYSHHEQIEQRVEIERLRQGMDFYDLELMDLWDKGYSTQEIASLQGIPVGTAKTRISALRRRLLQQGQKLGLNNDSH
ncbi:hypothetical protein K7W42_16265 [Deinococcus sp. HMF7604]|uniref:RNA polymerase sigma factor n=1 Tax=Deinococcus betulae TaxID=2873312 RepID=UPI001CCCEA1A|nr:hypothetical protein [Deinococcus betulae]MBZ9752404.1 hypothetical protein [Deinococcus betulae]